MGALLPDDMFDDPEVDKAAEALSNMVGPAPKKRARNRPRTPPGVVRAAQAAVRERLTTREWASATPEELVGLFAWCHAKVYAVEAEVALDRGASWWLASRAAASQLANDHHGDAVQMVDYIRWVWDRENGRERWRRQNGREGGRLSWRLVLGQGTALLADWRLSIARRNGT